MTEKDKLVVLSERPQTQSNKVETCKYGAGRYEVSAKGVYFISTDVELDKDFVPEWVCSKLNVLAMTRDSNGNEWGRLLEWRDRDGFKHQWAMPMELLQGDGAEVRRELVRQGLTISTNRNTRVLLSTYIQVWPVETRARCVDRLGWHGSVYVTSSESIGQDSEIVMFQNAHPLEPALSVSGTHEEWRNSVARLAAGNSRLIFALSLAFAAPLAKVAGEDSGGFHFRGPSSTGKTTVLKAAASVWGNPNTFPRLWRATINGLEGLAALHNDGLLILDELAQINPNEAGEAAYLLANGQGKARASRTGLVRQPARWRLLFLSAGEVSLAALMSQAGKKVNVGQELRLADLDADAGAGMGIFEKLHDQPTPAALVLAIKEAALHCHGAVGLAWLKMIVTDRSKLANVIADGMHQFVAENTAQGTAGQEQRVAQRFALVAVSGELATSYGLTGWEQGEATKAARICFNSWMESFGGSGNRETRNQLSQVRAFFEMHGNSRFGNIEASMDQRIPNQAGFYRTKKNGNRTYIVLTEAYRLEVCKGLDARDVTKTLKEFGWIEPGSDGKSTQKIRLPGFGNSTRCYIFTSKIWEYE